MSPSCHFSKCIHIAIDSLFITLKLKFTKFSIPFSIKEARAECVCVRILKYFAFFELFNNTLQADQNHQWSGVGSELAIQCFPNCNVPLAAELLLLHFICSDFIACSLDVISAHSKVSQSCKKAARNALS